MTKTSLIINKNNPKILAKKLHKIKKKYDIDYNQLIKVINIKDSAYIKMNLINIHNIPKYIDYEDFIFIICRNFLRFFPVKTWKKFINKINNFDLTYPLFWACEYGSYDSVVILLSNGAVYKPSLDKKMLSPISIIIKMLNANRREKLLINFKNFCCLELNNNQKKIEVEISNYKKTFLLLLNKFPNIVNNINEFNDIYLISTLHNLHFDFSKELLSRYKLLNDNSLKIIIFNFEKIFRLYLNLYKNMVFDTDNKIIFTEYVRYKILLIFDLIINLLENKNLPQCKIEKLKQLILKKFGSFSYYDSIFHKFYEKDDITYSSSEFEISKIFSTFQRRFELTYEKNLDFYLLYIDKFNLLKNDLLEYSTHSY
jgi:hypothetical protein